MADPNRSQRATSPRAPARVRLLPLRPSQLEEYLRPLIEEYARDHVRDGQWTEAEAPGRARAEVSGLLSQGVETPGHYLRSIVQEPNGTDVGRLWFAVRKDGTAPPCVFIYDLLVFEPHRGHGYGEAALRALEPVARDLGVERIGLHVFGHNRTAIRLYERAGYRTTNLLMSRYLNEPESERPGPGPDRSGPP